MAAYILRRFAIAIPTLLGAFVLIFLLTRFVPGDPVLIILEEYYTRESYEAIERQLGLDKPAWEQLIVSLGNTLQGDLGTSFQNSRPVMTNISDQIRPTVELTIAAMLISAVIGIPAGIIAAVNHNRWADYLSMIISLLALCAPTFWLGILLILVFSLKLEWLPTFGVGDPGSPVSTVKHLILPAFALGASGAGLIARVARSSMLGVLSEDYIRTARAKGVAERTVVYQHGLRNALIPIVTIFGLDAISLLTGTVVVETVFARRGIGRLLVDAILTRDYPQIQGILLMFVLLAIIVNLLVDIGYSLADPRIRIS